MDEAIVLLREAGIDLDVLRVRAFPFSDDIVDFILGHDRVFVVEQNRDAQLRTLLIAENAIDPQKVVPVLHYDGTPITARFIAQSIGALVADSHDVREEHLLS
jgi:2-oxoglutarate ferredoxin oxidoreductase subunit alpha